MESIVNGVLLRAVDYNENDKIITILTAENGKISAGIKGVKKATAKLRFAVQPFCFAEYVLTRRGDKYTVINATECESFYDLRTDIVKFYAASAAIEAADALSMEGDDCNELFLALVDTLSKICEGNENERLIAFLLIALKQAGYALYADKCPVCGRDLKDCEKLRFDMEAGSFICADCGEGALASKVTYNVIRKAQGKSYEKELITPDGERRALRLVREYLAYKTNITLKSLSEYMHII